MSGKLISGPKVGYDLARLGAGAARGANRKNQLNAAAWSGTWPAPGSSLDLDFVNNRGWVRGSGQGGVMDAITFTRASNGTYVGEDGLLKSYSNQGALGKNLLTFPQDFDNSWVTLNSTVNKNATLAPDNTFSAVKLIENTNNGLHYVRQVNGTGFIDQTVTFSVYIKKSERNWAYLYSDLKVPNPLAYFDLQNGVTGTAVDCTSNIVDFGDDWYRCTITFATTLVGSAFAALVGIATENSGGLQSYVGDGTSGIFIWGAQLEEGDQATEYFPTNIGVPRFDWGSTTQLPRRNLFTFTENLDNSVWTKTLLSVSDVGNGKWNLTPNTNINVTNGLSQGQAARPNIIQTLSFLVEAAGASYFHVRAGVQPNRFMALSIDLTTGSTNTTGGGGEVLDVSVATEGSAWQVIVSYTLSDGTIGSNVLFSVSTVPIEPAFNPLCTGDGVSGVILAYPQLELSESATSYQPIAHPTASTPLAANPTMNGILIEEARTNRVLWCRDVTQTVPYIPPDNFFVQSETFTNASWNFDGNQTQLVRTENQSDPFDGTSATKIVPNAGRTAANAYIGQRSGASYPSTHSIYAKAAEYDYLVLSLFTYAAGNFAVFNLSDGTITTSPTVAGLTAAIESVGDGWYRCSLTTSNETLNRGFLVSVSPNGTTTATAAGGSGIFIYGAHSNNGDTPTTYVQTTVLDPALWILSDITAAKDQTGIDGVANAASSLTATANNGTCFQYTTLLSGARSCSAYLKRITGTGIIQITLDGVTWSTVELSDTEWRRVVLSGIVTNPVFGIKFETDGDVIAMDYAQVEDGGFATTPILTTITAVTRISDFITQRGGKVNDWLDVSQGMLYCDFTNTGMSGLTLYDASIISFGTTQTNNFWNPVINYRSTGTILNPSNINISVGSRNITARFLSTQSQQRINESAAVNGMIGISSIVTTSFAWDIFGIGNSARSLSANIAGAFTIKRIFFISNRLSGNAMIELTQP